MPIAYEEIEAENRILHRVIETISSSLDLDVVLDETIDLVMAATRGDACFLHLYDAERRMLTLRAASEGFRDVVDRVVLDMGEGIAGWVAEHREVVIIPENKFADPRYKYIPELRGEQFTSLLSVPLVSRSGALVGAFNVHARDRRDFSDRDVEFLRSTSSLVAAAIEHAHVFRSLEEKEGALADLVRRTIETQEEERRRLANEIHDGVTQQLVSAWYRLQALRRHLRDPERAETELTRAQEMVDAALEEARWAIQDLRPTTLDDLGLGPSLKALVARSLEDEATFELDIDDEIELPKHHEVAVYRICQEALNNVWKHANASHVAVRLATEDSEVVLRVTDDGEGFDVDTYRERRPETSFGLLGIAERADLIGGRIDVRSKPGTGTTVEVRLPRGERSP
ncbi:MAG: GAF domain-containing sensor histidine kinase [Actinomycetota bacterium]